jgi:hypothetical protein
VEFCRHRVTVLRDGRTIDTRLMSEVDRHQLIQLMVGRELSAVFPKKTVEMREVVLELRHFGCSETGISDVNLSVRAGEIVGLAGLVGLAALLNAARFSSVPGNAGLGLELKAVAAVVVGGTEITGGRGRLVGTLIGVALLGTIGTALTFLGINPFWEKAIQGAIILAALISDVALGRLDRHVRLNAGSSNAD